MCLDLRRFIRDHFGISFSVAAICRHFNLSHGEKSWIWGQHDFATLKRKLWLDLRSKDRLLGDSNKLIEFPSPALLRHILTPLERQTVGFATNGTQKGQKLTIGLRKSGSDFRESDYDPFDALTRLLIPVY